jgi:hypothetical protein
MEAKIAELTAKISKVKNSCHKSLLIEERDRLVAKSNEQKRSVAILRAPAVAWLSRQ